MTTRNSLMATVCCLGLTALALIAYWRTRADRALPEIVGPEQNAQLVDQSVINTARYFGNLVYSSVEQDMANQAYRLADHYTDQSFAMALREASLSAENGKSNESPLQQKIDFLRKKIQEERTKGDEIDSSDGAVAKAQLMLDEDELNDAIEELSLKSGDIRQHIQEQLVQYEYRTKLDEAVVHPARPQIWTSRGITLASLFADWQGVREKKKLLEEERVDIAQLHQDLTEHERLLDARMQSMAQPSSKYGKGTAEQTIAAIELKTGYENLRSIARDREGSLNLLSAVYKSWLSVTDRQATSVIHALMKSISLMLAILICGIASLAVVHRLYGQTTSSNKRLGTTEVAYRALIRLLCAIGLLLMIFGVPSQLATILALAGAGLTVILKDYFVALFGWFFLMSKNGIRVGDSVEINGISGEVISLGLMRTVLQETGTWTDPEHPTGRTVTFTNNFAVEGHYFNFTTGCRLFWDEIELFLPADAEPFTVAEKVRAVVSAAIPRSSVSYSAEREQFAGSDSAKLASASPSVDVRPTANGVTIVIRYVTSLTTKNELRSMVYRLSISALSHGPSQASDVGQSEQLHSSSGTL